MGNRVYSGEDADIEESILMHGVVVQPGAIVRRAIIDKWTTIPSGTQIGVDLEADRKRFTVTDSGIVCVPRGYDFDRNRRADDHDLPSDADFVNV